MAGPDDAELRDRYLARIRRELEEIRAASASTADDRRPVELDQQSVGRLSRMDAIERQAMASAVERRRHGRVAALTAALARLERGHFGWCDECGEFIGERRLDLDPVVTLCVGCAGRAGSRR